MAASAKTPNGMLPIPASATKRPTTTPKPSKSQSRAGLPKLRLIVRRLPPGLTEDEFQTALGDEWKVGAGKVDWAAYREGKITKDPSKPSKPARAYLKVKEQSYLDLLSAKVKQTTFQDAKNTSKDPCLLGPPSLEFAPFGKVPGSRVRHDGRQGTIDQDPEFIDFLQSLTEPVAKSTGNGEDSDLKQGKVTTTPLVQFIKEKKANKAKEALAAKNAKASAKADQKESKPEKPVPKVSVVKAPPSPEKTKREKATQDAVKAINKSVAAISGKAAPPKPPVQAAATKDSANPPPAKRERERGNVSIAAKILQRDLGLGPKERRVSGIGKTAASEPVKPNTVPVAKVNLPNTSAREAASQSPGNSPQPSNEPKVTPHAPPAGPRNAKPTPPIPQLPKPSPMPAQRPPKPNPVPSAGAKSAFLKHANPSQGVTEPLLEAAFSTFGTLTRCEIDKKKGFGYVDFADPEGLKKAMQASPVKVGNGQVVVLENKPKPTAKTPTSQGPANSPQSKALQPQVHAQQGAQPQVAKIETASAPAGTTTPPSTISSTPAPAPGAAPTPTAPRASPVNVRGGRGGPMGTGRGGFGPPTRTGRGGFRGRGGFFPNQHRGGGSAGPNSNTSTNPQTQTSTVATIPSPANATSAKEGTEGK